MARGGRAFVTSSPLVFGGGSRSWSPSSLSLNEWYDATDYSTFTFGSGSKVASWANKGSSGGAFAQGSASLQPSYSASYNGYVGVVCTSAASMYLSKAAYSWTEVEAFIVFRNNSSPGNSWAIWGLGAAAPSNHHPFAADLKLYDDCGTTGRKDAIVPGKTLNSQTLINVQSKANDWKMWVDGTLVYSTATNTVGYSATSMFLMRSVPGNSAYEGAIREFGLRTTAFTSQERADMTAGMKAKWGIP